MRTMFPSYYVKSEDLQAWYDGTNGGLEKVTQEHFNPDMHQCMSFDSEDEARDAINSMHTDEVFFLSITEVY